MKISHHHNINQQKPNKNNSQQKINTKTHLFLPKEFLNNLSSLHKLQIEPPIKISIEFLQKTSLEEPPK
jgi:hypothetical protein